LNPSAIDIDRIPGFSTNSIPHSKKHHLFIKFNEDVKKTYNADWKEGNDGLYPTKESYEIVSTRKIFFIPLLKLHGYKGKYHNPPEKTDKAALEFTLKICHKPLVSNFWHFEFLVVDAAGNEIKGNGKGYRKTVYSSIRDKIQDIAVF